jgi:hypothetical protein
MRKTNLLIKEMKMTKKMNKKRRKKIISIMNMEESMERKDIPSKIMKRKKITLKMVSTTKTL